MKDIKQRLANVAWRNVEAEMHARGYAHVPGLLTREPCDKLSHEQPSYPSESFFMTP